MADIRTSGILDDFEGPTEAPMSNGGRWRILDQNQNDGLQRFGGKCGLYTGINSNGHRYWAEHPVFDGNFEVWAERAGTHDDGTSSSLGVTVGGFTEGFNTAKGYYLRSFNSFAGSGTSIVRYDAWPTLITLASTATFQPIHLLRRRGNDLEGWHSTDGIAWTLGLTVTDTTYMTGMRFAIGHSIAIATTDTWLYMGGVPVGSQQVRWMNQ
jgi:hypothetical protein